MTRARFIGLRLPPELWLAVQNAIAQSGMHQAEWLRQALAQSLESQVQLAVVRDLLAVHQGALTQLLRQELNRHFMELEIVEDSAPTAPKTRRASNE